MKLAVVKTGIVLLSLVTIAILIALVVGGSPGPSTTAAEFTVCPNGCPYSSVQEAIDAAPPWTHILVKEGVYKVPDGKSITITKDLILQGEDPEKVIIQGGSHPPRGRVDIPVIKIEDAQVVITGFTITGGPRPKFPVCDSGISIEGGSTVIIYNNRITGNNGLAIEVRDTAQATIHNNLITGRSDAEYPVLSDGILIAERAQAYIHDNVIANIIDPAKGIYVMDEAQAKIWGNSIHDIYGIGIQVGADTYRDWETGYDLEGMAQASIHDNEIYNNAFEGIAIAGNGMADIFNNKIHHNGWAGVAVKLTDPLADCCSVGYSSGYPFKGVLTGEFNEIHDNGQGYQCRFKEPLYCPPAPKGLDLCPPDYPWPENFVKGE